MRQEDRVFMFSLQMWNMNKMTTFSAQTEKNIRFLFKLLNFLPLHELTAEFWSNCSKLVRKDEKQW